MKISSPQSLQAAENRLALVSSYSTRRQDPKESIRQLAHQLEEWEQLVKETNYFLGEIKIWAKPQRKV